ncbi:MAG TPA: DinB family protein [Acidimicrobiales bacterium]|nr:DinB family protein [Acidimicrobiales bacterium]
MTGSGSEHAASLDRLRATARDLVSLTSSADRARLHRAPGPREWSAAQVVGHLADAELVYAVRFRQMIVEDRPHLAAFDEDAWAQRFALLDDELKDTVARWRALRDSTLRLLDSLEDADWRRAGVHAERGELNVRQMAALLADHDRSHLDQIRHALAG